MHYRWQSRYDLVLSMTASTLLLYIFPQTCCIPIDDIQLLRHCCWKNHHKLFPTPLVCCRKSLVYLGSAIHDHSPTLPLMPMLFNWLNDNNFEWNFLYCLTQVLKYFRNTKHDNFLIPLKASICHVIWAVPNKIF
jgi:hypothetical protein